LSAYTTFIIFDFLIIASLMIIYVNLDNDTKACCFRNSMYALLKELGYAVVNSGKQYMKIDTTAKTSIELDKINVQPTVTSATSWKVVRNLINS